MRKAKIPRDYDFPTIIHVGHFLNAKRPNFAFVKNVSIYFKFFNRSATIISLYLSPVTFYLHFCVN